MKKARILLSATAVLAIAASAFAFKAHRNITPYYIQAAGETSCTLTVSNLDVTFQLGAPVSITAVPGENSKA